MFPETHPFLARFDEEDRGKVANLVFHVVRSIEGEAGAIIGAVLRILERGDVPFVHEWAVQDAVRLTIEQQPQEALSYAYYCLAWEALPAPTRKALRAATQEKHRDAWQAAQPITDRQREALRNMGVPEWQIPNDRLGASRLIQERIDARR